MNVIFFHSAHLYNYVINSETADDGSHYVTFDKTSNRIEYKVVFGSSLILAKSFMNTDYERCDFIEELNKLNTKDTKNILEFLKKYGNVIGFEDNKRYSITSIVIMIDRLRILINLYNSTFSKKCSKKTSRLFFRYFFENPKRYSRKTNMDFHVPKITQNWYDLKKYYLAHNYNTNTNYIKCVNTDEYPEENGVYIDLNQDYENIKNLIRERELTDEEDDMETPVDIPIFPPYFSEPLLKSIPTSYIRTAILANKNKHYSDFFIKLLELYDDTHCIYTIEDEGVCKSHCLLSEMNDIKLTSESLDDELKRLEKVKNDLCLPEYLQKRSNYNGNKPYTKTHKLQIISEIEFINSLISAEQTLDVEKNTITSILTDDFKPAMNIIITKEISSLIKKVKPRLSNNMTDLRYETSDLLSLILVSIIRPYDDSKEQRDCANINCDNTFIAPKSDTRKRFCCTKCRNATNQRLYRQNEYAKNHKKSR